MWTAFMAQSSGIRGDASGRPNVPGGRENIGERLPQLRIMSNFLPAPSKVSGRTMGDSLSMAGMAGAVSMAKASSPARWKRVSLKKRKAGERRTWSRAREPNDASVGEIGIRDRRGHPRRRKVEGCGRACECRGPVWFGPVLTSIRSGGENEEKADVGK